jgi:hypothetical protein
MNLWLARRAAEHSLEGGMAIECGLLDRAFQQAEYLAQRLSALEPLTPFSCMAGLVTAKARNLAHACYSLALDGLAQESGAIGRVWLESIELLTFLRLFPETAETLLGGKRLPSAGERAKKVNSSVGNIRKYWNETASHMGFEWDTWRHIVKESSGKLQTRQEFRYTTLRGNLEFIFAMMIWTIRESVLCLNAAQGFVEEGIARQMDSLRDECFKAFNMLNVAMEAAT